MPDDLDEREAPLVRRLATLHGCAWVDGASHDDFVARAGDQVLFFTGDTVRFPECLDVAVVLPELQRAFPGRFGVGVVRRGDEDAIARRWGSQRWPSLVFVRDGQYVGTLSGMMDWTDYLARVAALLDTPASRPPIPLMGAQSASACH
ncbi:hydrogenase [Ideonella sp. 4Y11]|uniref:Hydrogenase expression/formation protein n=2 Tax=Ideonella aquatica TaxID=2824119 RepID=A0A941BNX9_9BURK|nr:hydrogenase [Ideonella aquatica]